MAETFEPVEVVRATSATAFIDKAEETVTEAPPIKGAEIYGNPLPIS